MSLHHVRSEKIYVVGFLSTAALAALIYVIWGPRITSKHSRKLAKKDSCPGLLNQGNSCFLNAILQACSTSQALRRWLEERSARDAGQAQLSSKLLNILKVLNNEVDEGDYGSPYDVIDALRAKRWVISSDEQDAHELFEVLTQSLEEDRHVTPTVVSLFDVTKLEVCVRCPSCVNRWGTDSPSLAHDKRHTYQGLLASKLQCKHCQYTCPIKYDAFDCLSLSLPSQSLGPCDLNQLLNSFIKPEVVEGVQCEGCTKKYRQSNPDASPRKSTFNKQTTLGKLPAAICFHIQRTMWLPNSMPCKRSDHVSFPEYLCMDVYTNTGRGRVQGKGLLGGRAETVGGTLLSLPASDLPATSDSHTSDPPPGSQTSHVSGLGAPPSEPAGRLYRLDAVIEHLGDVSSGHFVTHRRAPYSTLRGPYTTLRGPYTTLGAPYSPLSLMASPNWLYTSDTLVKRTKWSRVRGCAAYMLFYERISY